MRTVAGIKVQDGVTLNTVDFGIILLASRFAKADKLIVTSGTDGLREGVHGVGKYSSYHYGYLMYDGSHTGAVDFSVDTSDPQRDQIMKEFAEFCLKFRSLTIELIHSTPFSTDNGYYVKDGRSVGCDFYGECGSNPPHLSHVHWAMSWHTFDQARAITFRGYNLPSLPTWGSGPVVLTKPTAPITPPSAPNSGTVTPEMLGPGVDTSFAPPNYSQAKAGGQKWVMRYVCPLPNGKVLDPDERDRIFNAGLVMPGVNWEYDSGDALGGRARGVAHAKTALDQAKNWLKMPANRGLIIWFSVGDFDAQPYQFATIDAYIDGVKSVLGTQYEIGVYGGAGLLKHLKAKGVAKYYWQACAPTGWYDNSTRWSGAHIWQINVDVWRYSGSVDLNTQNLPLPFWKKGM